MKADFAKTVEDAILSPDYRSEKYVAEYLKPHMRRFQTTLHMLQGVLRPEMNVIDIGSYGSLVPALQEMFGLKHIVVTTPPEANRPASEDTCLADGRQGELFRFHTDRFDLEGSFPYRDEVFDLVIFTEVLEHLSVDPMHTLAEINRITRTGGGMMLSTPNCASAKSLLAILRGGNPNCYPIYTKQPSRDRHNREYTPAEVRKLLVSCGYEIDAFETTDVYAGESPAWRLFHAGLWLGGFFSLGIIHSNDRGDTIFALGRKVSGVMHRYPAFLYV